MDATFLPIILATLIIATSSTLDSDLKNSPLEELHAGAATYNSNKRLIPRQHIFQDNETDLSDKHSHSLNYHRVKQNFGSKLTSKTDKISTSRIVTTEQDTKHDLTGPGRVDETKDPISADEDDGMLMAGAGRRKNNKSKRGDDDDDDEDKKTLSQQIADGKYGLIEKEIYSTTPKRPGIISYSTNPEVPRDTAKNLGGLEPEEIWLAENHVLVLRGGYFPEHKFNRTDDTATAWPPIDDFNAPRRQVKIPANPKVPPPFPVQFTDDGPTQFIGFNGSAGPPPFPPFFPHPPPGNGSYFAPPFPFPPGNFTPGFYPPISPGNFPPGGGLYPPPGNGSFSPPRFPYPLPPPRNGSYFVPPPGNFTPGSGPFYPPPFPGFPPPRHNASFPPFPRPGIFPPSRPPNGTLSFPPHLFPHLPPGAAFLPPPGNLTEPFDEDDPSLYYPPPYDFYYPQDNSTEVPPGPLVPGIILPPPPNFFSLFNNHSEENKLPPHTNKESPKTDTPEQPNRKYLPGSSRPPANKDRRPPLAYYPVTTELRKKKPRPTVSIVDNDSLNHITPVPEIYVLTTIPPEKQNVNKYSEKPPPPPINLAKNVQVTHQGKSPVNPIPAQGYYYEKPTVVLTQEQKTDDNYNKVRNNIVVTTAVPAITYYTVPITDIIVQSTPRPQIVANISSQQNAPAQSVKTRNRYSNSKDRVQDEISKEHGKRVNVPTTTLAPLLVYYNQQQKDIESNTVTPPPQAYYVKTKDGPTATVSPPLVYYTVPSAGKSREPTSIRTSFYFYEEPDDESKQISDTGSTSTTQEPPPGKKTMTGDSQPYYNIALNRGKSSSQKVQPQQTFTNVLPVKGTVQAEQPHYIYTDVVENPVKDSAQTESPIQSDALPEGRTKGTRTRTRPQTYVLSPVIYPNRGKLPQSSTPAPPQYYYITAGPELQYQLVRSTTPPPLNQNYPSRPPQHEYVTPTPQPFPIISKLAYFTTPRPDFAYQDIISSQRPLLYNIQPSPTPRPIYQYSFEKSPATQQALDQTIYTTTRSKTQQPQRLKYPTGSQRATGLPLQYHTTPRTLFEYSFEQQSKAPIIQNLYSAVGPQYDDTEDVTAGSPTTHYGYEDREQNKQGHEYQSTPRPRYAGYRQPNEHNVYPTANPLHAYFTQQDETLLDDITKKYFTIFGQKIQSDENVPTTPIPPHAHRSPQSQAKQQYMISEGGQYYTTPVPIYRQHNGERPPESENGGQVPISLADDINVNYKNPPAQDPDAEIINPRQLGSSDNGGALVSYKFPGDGGHFYFITPQVVGQQPQQVGNGYIYSLPDQAPHQLGIIYRRKKRKEQR